MSFSKIYFSNAPIWEEKQTLPFNELILSWNGIRPPSGKWTFWVSLQEGEWLKYAEWSSKNQTSFKSEGAFALAHQDVVVPKKACNAFKIKVEGSHLENLHRLCVCVSHSDLYERLPPSKLSPVLLSDFPRQSQQLLDHPRAKDLCSPTSTSLALSYICKKRFDPVYLANRCVDMGFDIYGNWILNIAEAYHQSLHPCYVERMRDFSTLHSHLTQGRPVVVSVKGPIPKAPLPYAFGHLMCVIGYEEQKVICIDPAFPNTESTLVSYELDDFLTAWSRRRNLAYLFL